MARARAGGGRHARERPHRRRRGVRPNGMGGMGDRPDGLAKKKEVEVRGKIAKSSCSPGRGRI